MVLRRKEWRMAPRAPRANKNLVDGPCSRVSSGGSLLLCVCRLMLSFKFMGATAESQAFDRGVRPILEMVLPDKVDAVLNFRPEPALLSRIEELATKANEG